MSLHQFMRRQGHPLRQRHVDEARSIEQFEETQSFITRILDDMRHSLWHGADVAGLKIEGAMRTVPPGVSVGVCAIRLTFISSGTCPCALVIVSAGRLGGK